MTRKTTAKETNAKTTENGAATFEDDLKRLEAVVRDLESGALPLEDAFRRFEEGVRLSRSCRSRLEAIEGRIAELMADGETRSITPSAVDDE